jgi:queuine tRNA-ribosyltransferase
MKHPSSRFNFTLEKTVGKARVGCMSTPHGEVETPIFMPVGTQATVKSLDTEDIESTQAPIILTNTYHLYLRPGTKILNQHQGAHNFMHWQKPMLTDSGGFQVFSLGKQLAQVKQLSQFKQLAQPQRQDKKQAEANVLLKAFRQRTKLTPVKISDSGAAFTSHLDGSSHFFTPEKSIQIQRDIGADIIMNFDECIPDDAAEPYIKQSIDLTHRWAKQCFEYWEEHDRLSTYGTYQALFGIIQGGMNPEMRRESARYLTGQTSGLDFDGIAVGGETIGYNMPGTGQVMEWIEDLLPADKPRYAMGLGRDPQDIIDAVYMGFDMFDCVGPTRLARNGALYAGELDFTPDKPVFASPYKNGRLNIGRAEFATDRQPIQANCDCHTCFQGYTRSYLHHLYRTKELSYYRLASIHNIRVMIKIAQDLRLHLQSKL